MLEERHSGKNCYISQGKRVTEITPSPALQHFTDQNTGPRQGQVLEAAQLIWARTLFL